MKITHCFVRLLAWSSIATLTTMAWAFVSPQSVRTSATVGLPTSRITPATYSHLLLQMSSSPEQQPPEEEKITPPPPPPPATTTFREAEVLGLRYMQEGNHEKALNVFKKGLKLPGSRPDVIRNRSQAGPSPVGGSAGGTDSKAVMNLDEFELQAAQYNMACANAQLGNTAAAVGNLKLCFDYGFDNYATVRGDTDLQALENNEDFNDLMEEYEPKGFGSLFGLFGGK